MTDPKRDGVTRRQILQYGGAAAAAAAVASLPVATARAAAGTTAVVDLTQPPTPFRHVWERAVGGDWAKQALRRDYQDQLLEAHRELGLQSLRFHGILNTSTSLYIPKLPNGFTPLPATSQDPYRFFNVDQIYDFLVENGMRPYVELSSMPQALQAAPPPFQIFLYDYNPSEPSSYDQWGKLVGDFARHMVDRYGIAEVRTWPFEVWNEPNLFVFFSGDQQAYFKLYQAAAEAIKNVDASLQVGGPATSAGQISFGPPRSPGVQYYREFMAWATSNGVPVDFGSAHGYESDQHVGPEGPASFFKQNRADTPAGLPLYISETNITSSSSDPRQDQADAAASFLRTVIETVGVVDALAIWTFSDIFEELGQADNPFHGGFGLQTIYGIKKPTYRVMELLHRVGTQRLPLQLSAAPASVGGIAVLGDSGRGVDILLYNHAVPSGQDNVPPTPAEPATITVTVQGIRTGPGHATLTRIDADHANPQNAWQQMGSPEYPTRRQLQQIADASNLRAENLRLTFDRHAGTATFTLTLPAESIVAVHLDM